MIKVSKVVFNVAMVLHAGSLESDDCTYSIDYSKKNLSKLGISDDFTIDYRYYAPKQNTIFGIYMQKEPYLQTKLLNVISGAGILYLVDFRINSSTFGKYEAIPVNAKAHDLVYIPDGFGHAFLTTEPDSVILLKQTKPNIRDYYKIIDYKDEQIALDLPEEVYPYSRDVEIISLADYRKK